MKRMTKLISAALLVLGLHVARAEDISVKGSDTVLPLGQKWAEVYMKKNPGTSVQVTGGGSGTGIAALLNGTIDICNASRPMKPAEIADFAKKFKTRPHEYKIAMDGLSVYVNEGCPLKKISIPQLEQVFTGKATNWKDIGGPDAPISLYGRENSSGTYEFFKEHILKGKDFAASTKTMPGTAAIIEAVAKDPNAIGYGGVAYAKGVRALAVSKTDGGEAIEPTEPNVISRKYPISRYLFNYVSPAKDAGSIAQYVRWCLSPEGQALVKDVGYFPLPKNLISR
ncbi:MAG: PstS family phosphate ABC transporter substrate-binding protein [Verrucomicrobiae bacterium]|nr:PstS family phosphate ABC transporter substrate-binding protein [Verrucomicrobiae bacterium]